MVKEKKKLRKRRNADPQRMGKVDTAIPFLVTRTEFQVPNHAPSPQFIQPSGRVNEITVLVLSSPSRRTGHGAESCRTPAAPESDSRRLGRRRSRAACAYAV